MVAAIVDVNALAASASFNNGEAHSINNNLNHYMNKTQPRAVTRFEFAKPVNRQTANTHFKISLADLNNTSKRKDRKY